MSYHEDSIDWQDIAAIDAWLDGAVMGHYKGQPLAQDWARVSKIGEELGEAIQALIGATGQNPRKGVTNDFDVVLGELADVFLTGLLAIQHFTKDTSATRRILRERLHRVASRVPTEYLYGVTGVLP
jgi:hypothetical protein